MTVALNSFIILFPEIVPTIEWREELVLLDSLFSCSYFVKFKKEMWQHLLGIQ